MRGEGGRGRRGVERAVFVVGRIEGASPDSVAIPDEEIDDGGGESGLEDEGGRLEIGDNPGDWIGLGVLPWKTHAPLQHLIRNTDTQTEREEERFKESGF